MKKGAWIALGIGIVLLVITVNIVARNYMKSSHKSNPSVKVFQVKRDQMYDTLLASGIVVTRNEEKKYKDESMGQIAHWYVTEGQKIAAGTELFQYDGEDLSDKMETIQINGEKLLLQIEQNKQKFDDLEMDFKKSMYDVSELEESVRKAKSQKNDLERNFKNLELELRLNEMEKESLTKKMARLVVKSNIAGVVKKINLDTGTSQNELKQQPIIQIVSEEPYKVEGTVTEFDSVHVKTGQTVTVKPKVLSGEVWQGKVSSIDLNSPENNSAEPTAKNPVTSYPFTVEITDTKDGLQEGYHAAVEIHINEKQGVLILPKDAFLVQDHKEFVFVVKDGKMNKTQVETGLVNDVMKEVTSGVSEGDVVARNPQHDWVNGMDVVVDDKPD